MSDGRSNNSIVLDDKIKHRTFSSGDEKKEDMSKKNEKTYVASGSGNVEHFAMPVP